MMLCVISLSTWAIMKYSYDTALLQRLSHCRLGSTVQWIAYIATSEMKCTLSCCAPVNNVNATTLCNWYSGDPQGTKVMKPKKSGKGLCKCM